VITPLGCLVVVDPAAARRRLLDAIEASGGDRSKAATELGISHRQFYRLIARLGLWPAIDRLCRVRKFPVVPGPPRKRE
jgi:transcriptional regulator with GAF, ATPase, and Fis domain